MKKKYKVVLGVLGAVAVVGGALGGYAAYTKITKGSLGGSLFGGNDDTKAYDNASKEEKQKSDEIKKEIEDLNPTPSPEDVVIPPDATEEEKEDLEEKKLYLETVQFMSNSFNNYYTDDTINYIFSRINNIYVSNQGIEIDLTYYSEFEGLYFENRSMLNLEVDTSSITDLKTLNQVLKSGNFTNSYKKNMGVEDSSEVAQIVAERFRQEYGSELFFTYNPQLVSSSYDYYMMSPSVVNLYYSSDVADHIIGVKVINDASNLEEFVALVKSGSYTIEVKKSERYHKDTINWTDLQEKYGNNAESSANAEASAESEISESEKVVAEAVSKFQTKDGFDLKGYNEYIAQLEAKKNLNQNGEKKALNSAENTIGIHF